MLKIVLIILLLYCTVSTQRSQRPCQNEILATARISRRKCEEYSSMIKKPLQSGSNPPCGWKNVSDCGQIGFQGIGIDGEEAAPMEFPHMAALGYTNEDGSTGYYCAGSLISDRFVLTAAHCLWHSQPDVVLLGDSDLKADNDTAWPIKYAIKRVIKHEFYHMRKNDIALIELSEKVTFNRSFIRPACLQIDEWQFNEDTLIVATGWGLLKNFGPTSDKLMKIGFPIHDMDQCQADFYDDYSFDESQICAGGKRGKVLGLKFQETCSGDSGGPLQLPINNDTRCVYKIIGLFSHGPPFCAKGSASIYTKVSHFIDWIESKVWPVEYREWEARKQH